MLDRRRLPDAIEPADALLEQFRIRPADRRAPDDARTGSCVPRCRSPSRCRMRAPSSSAKYAALRSRCSSVSPSWKSAALTLISRSRRVVDVLRQLARAADEQHLLRRRVSCSSATSHFIFASKASSPRAASSGDQLAPCASGNPDSAARVLRNITRPVPNSSSSAATSASRAVVFARSRVPPTVPPDALGLLARKASRRPASERLAREHAIDGRGDLLVVLRLCEEVRRDRCSDPDRAAAAGRSALRGRAAAASP